MDDLPSAGNGLQNGASVVLQRRLPDGSVDCRPFKFRSAPSPALIHIVAGPDARAEQHAHQLQDALERALRTMSQSMEPVSIACPAGPRIAWNACDAHRVHACRKVLVVVAADTPLSPDPIINSWKSAGEEYAIIPLLPEGADPEQLLPSSLLPLNVGWWIHSPAERSDEALGLAGLGSEDRRVFISYRRQDTSRIAEQLYDALNRQRFDVFLDRFSVSPGRDFQERLMDELADKAMIIVLESESILTSEWVGRELTFAKKLGLGHLAINLSGAPKVPWLDDEFRVLADMSSGDVVRLRSGDEELTSAGIERAVARIVEEHTRALIRRRWALIDSMRTEFARRGISDVRLDVRGHVHVRVPKPAREYVVWAAPRPPAVGDFRTAHGVCHPGPEPKGVVVTPARFVAAGRRHDTAWLALVSGVHVTDAGRIGELADAIREGEELP